MDTRTRICQRLGGVSYMSVVPYVENTLYSTNKYSCVRRVHTLYITYFVEHNGDDEPHELAGVAMGFYMPARRSCDWQQDSKVARSSTRGGAIRVSE